MQSACAAHNGHFWIHDSVRMVCASPFIPIWQCCDLNRVVLINIWLFVMAFKGNCGPIPSELTNRQYRLTAYQQFIHWHNQGTHMSEGLCVVLPSCIAQMIRRNAFPEEDPTKYKGFEELNAADGLIERHY